MHRLLLILVPGFLVLGMLASCSITERTEPGTVTVVLDEGPQSLDVRIGLDATSERLFQLMYVSLVRKSKEFTVEPDLALSWDIPNPTTYIFHLRDDAYFHNGKKITSRDVVYTFNSLLNGEVKSIKRGTYLLVESVKAPDDKTVVFKLKEPYAPFLWNLTRGAIGIVPEGSGPNLGFNPEGSAEFKFVRYVADGEVVLERNDRYYGPKPHIKTARFKIVPEAAVRALELRKGSGDIALNVLTPDMVEVLKRNPDLQVMNTPGTVYQYIAFNMRDPVFADVRVRKAVAYAIDRNAIINYLWRGEARLATGVIPLGNWSYNPDVTAYPYDPERARQLLKEAGKTNLEFGFRISTDEIQRTLAAVFQQQLNEVGIKMTIQTNEPATFSADIAKGNFQTFTRRWIGGNNDPDIFDAIFGSKRIPPDGYNRGFYFNTKVDELIRIGRIETDLEKRKAAYFEVQKIAAEELPYVSLFWLNNVAVFTKRVEGMTLYPSGEYEFLSDITVKD